MALHTLPNELLEMIATPLSLHSLVNLRSVNKELYTYLEPYYYRKIETLPWRIVHHFIEHPHRVEVVNVWVTLGDYRNNHYSWEKSPLPHEYCEYCERLLIKGRGECIHNEELVHANWIKTTITEGIGGEMVDKILKASRKRNYALLVNVGISGMGGMGGINGSKHQSKRNEIVELSNRYMLLLPGYDEVKETEIVLYPFRVLDLDKYAGNRSICFNGWHIGNLDHSINYGGEREGMDEREERREKRMREEEEEDLGDYDLDRYRNGTYQDFSEYGDHYNYGDYS